MAVSCMVSAAGEKVFFEVKKDRGVPRIFKNGKVVPSRIFFGSFKHGWYKYAKEAVPREFGYASKVAGVELFECHGNLLWNSDRMEKLKEENKVTIERFLSANPNGYALVRLGSVPPPWWFNEHPEASSLWNTGAPEQRQPGWARLPSLASEFYQKEAEEALRRTIRFYEENYPGRIAGYHIGGLHTSEWLYDTNYVKESEGYDIGTRTEFKRYLREKYKTDKALQEAWNDKSITLDTADVPAHEERIGDGKNFLREPVKDQKLLDFFIFHTELVADTICKFAKIAKEEAPGRLVGFFYGYASLGSWYGGGGKNGYLAFRKVLESPDVDFFCSPFSYNGRQRNKTAVTQGIIDSIAAAGKLWMNEDDTATYLAYITQDGGPSMYSSCRTPRETAEMLRRNLAFTYMNNHAIWWMDLNGAGWFDDPEMWNTMKEFLPLEKALLENPKAFEPELAIALDQQGAMHFIGEHSKEGAPPNFASDHVFTLGFVGAPVGVYLQDDILEGRIKAKMTAFLSCYAMDGKQRAAMRRYAENNGCIWLWAPGYIDLDTGKISLKAVEEATGFEVREQPKEINLVVKATEAGKKLGLPENMGGGLRYGVPQVVQPSPTLSPVPKKGDVVLGVYSNDAPAVVLRMVNGKPHVFFGTTVVPPALFRHAGKLAGAYFYTEAGPAVYSNGREIAVYAPRDLKAVITAPAKQELTEYFSGRKYSGGKIDVSMKQGETILLSPLGVTSQK